MPCDERVGTHRHTLVASPRTELEKEKTVDCPWSTRIYGYVTSHRLALEMQ